jgi:hypothetical protein
MIIDDEGELSSSRTRSSSRAALLAASFLSSFLILASACASDAATLEVTLDALSGDVTHYPNDGVFIARTGPGDIVAFSDKTPWDPPTRDEPCTLRWFPDETFGVADAPGVFRDPCSGATFAPDGRLLLGPADRNLDRYEVAIEDGAAVVDLDGFQRGEPVASERP